MRGFLAIAAMLGVLAGTALADERAYWFCKQDGTRDKRAVYVYSNVFETDAKATSSVQGAKNHFYDFVREKKGPQVNAQPGRTYCWYDKTQREAADRRGHQISTDQVSFRDTEQIYLDGFTY
jgi:hypothetical protein